MSYDSSVDRLVQNLTRRDAQMRVPPQPTLTLRQGLVVASNPETIRCHVVLSGGTKVLPNLSYLMSYGPDHDPEPEHTCWVALNGNDPIVIGRHISF